MSDENGPGSAPWRREQLERTLAFARGSVVERGFAWLDDRGRPRPEAGLQMWINARMTYVFSLASLRGVPGAAGLAAHGIVSLTGPLADPEHGGWFHEVGLDGVVRDPTKSCYDHSFVLLASAGATVAGVPGAADLFDDARAVHEARFWDPTAGLCRESWDRAWRTSELYRGANSNMHAVEAFLVTADATGDSLWRTRALAIVEHLVHRTARANDWRVVEHFTESWEPLLEHNRDRPADPFRPYGATPGHGFEWARLMVQLEAALPEPPGWLAPAAVDLFARAAADGICYTTDWSGRPVVEERFHWVVAEALMAADALRRRTGDTSYDVLSARWWDLVDQHFVDRLRGSWHHELAPDLSVSRRTWDGKPDAFHIVNALLAPDLPLAPTAPTALSASVPPGNPRP